jgi:type IV pilus assembly protein PilB
MAKREGLEIASPEEVTVDEQIMRKLPRELVEEHRLVPISHTATHLRIAIVDPADLPAIEEVRFLTGLEVQTVLAASADVQRAVGKFYGKAEPSPARGRQRGDVHKVAREVGGLPSAADANRAVAEIEASPAKLIRALAALLVEKRYVSAEELRQRVRQLEQ